MKNLHLFLRSALWLLAIMLSQHSFGKDFGEKTLAQFYPYAEWQLSNSSYSGNAFDLVATVTFTHSTSGKKHTTEMFYDGNNTWKFRFMGSITGKWTFTTSSSDGDLNGHTGSIHVVPNPNKKIPGLLGKHPQDPKKWAVQTGDNEWKAVLPQYFMWHEGSSMVGRSINPDLDLFIKDHGFTGVHLSVKDPDLWTNNGNPDPVFFRDLEQKMVQIQLYGALSHIWMWGDASRGLTPPGGINSSQDKRLQRYICARLAAIPNWSVGYGFDLHEWTNERQLDEWHDYMTSKMGWKHYTGARSNKHQYNQISERMAYSSYELHKTSQPQPWNRQWMRVVDERPLKPSFSEDRFRVRGKSKDVSLEETRRGLYYATMAGGAASIWGNLRKPGGGNNSGGRSFEYPNKNEIKTWSTFFNDKNRFVGDMVRKNDLTDGQALYSPSKRAYVVYKERTSSIQLNIQNVNGSVPVVAVDARKSYREISLGSFGNGNRTFSLPNSSDWVIAVGEFDGTDPNLPTYTLTVNNGAGDGEYTEGSFANIIANQPTDGSTFDRWTGDVQYITDVSSASTTVTMPARDISVTATFKQATQEAYTTHTIPGKIECELYDKGGQGIAYNDDDKREGGSFRSQDNVDIVDKSAASAGRAIGYSRDGEWVEFTIASITEGTYDITFTYSSGSSNNIGDLQVSLDGAPLSTITDIKNTGGWDTFTTVTVSNVFVPGGPGKIMRLEYVNGSRFDLDAIEFIPSGATTTYTLTVVNGSGSGAYPEGAGVNISANTPPAGQVFDQWTGDVATVVDVNNPTTQVMIPNKNITLTPAYRDNSTGGDVIISDLSPSDYEIVPLENGIEYYTDRSFRIESIPASLANNHLLIKTANNDKNGGAVAFRINTSTTIYVGYDARASTPGWLAGYTKLNEKLETTDALGLNLYRTTAGPGAVFFGKNNAKSMYVVLVEANPPAGASTMSTAQEAETDDITIYPNPTSDVIHITTGDATLQEVIITTENSDRMVRTYKESTIDMSLLRPGIYYVTVVTDQGQVTRKIIKQ